MLREMGVLDECRNKVARLLHLAATAMEKATETARAAGNRCIIRIPARNNVFEPRLPAIREHAL